MLLPYSNMNYCSSCVLFFVHQAAADTETFALYLILYVFVSSSHLEKDGLGKHSCLTCSKYHKICSYMIKRTMWLRFDVAALKKFHDCLAHILFLEHFSAGLPLHLLLLIIIIFPTLPPSMAVQPVLWPWSSFFSSSDYII